METDRSAQRRYEPQDHPHQQVQQEEDEGRRAGHGHRDRRAQRQQEPMHDGGREGTAGGDYNPAHTVGPAGQFESYADEAEYGSGSGSSGSGGGGGDNPGRRARGGGGGGGGRYGFVSISFVI